MATITSFFPNSSHCHGTVGTINVLGISQTKYVSSWGLQVKASKVNGTSRNGGILLPANTTVVMKTRMMMDQKKMHPNMVSDVSLGRMVHNGFVFRQNFCIRSYEVGPDGRALVETLMNQLQETFLNHFKTAGLTHHDNYGVTPEMCNKNLFWAIAKTQVEVDRYPRWGDVIQIDTWISAFGKNGMSTNWMLCDCKTGDILMRASSTFVMINKETRRLSKIPLEVRAELEKYFVDTAPIIEEITSNFPKLDKNNVYVRNELITRWSDLDANQHVNNVKYIGWILQDVPELILESYELASMTLKYCRECTKGSVVHAYTSVLGDNNGGIAYYDHVDCQHQLQLDVAGGDGEIILEGRTRWRPKQW
ncbi:palmitoyl-acyl carrier protein thioesterase, chloroplastic-like [Cynara cardunculus var. scolymus]|uniref:palmitoyl-acyl carrier protein thioesterase, chloroplastic-like n=1 Tax=Cynara cardunculus var. scolymus TaxID=59895 RepID=UPI000D630250|nr:palmitoyl-acyl carrier protein thioesterase, chloroplastic-like [Cynara cardunculus var. scolymus]